MQPVQQFDPFRVEFFRGQGEPLDERFARDRRSVRRVEVVVDLPVVHAADFGDVDVFVRDRRGQDLFLLEGHPVVLAVDEDAVHIE
ncbi:hypothetical protein C481_19740 [Natrialba asiatica DSM 12278]|uniref:Uncharacterized protein n=1 Tax=Natrialba asiatica (strain ATCC 700177 / DSM 12278 / JCM 9576 / FERM P-10747 / NBRC 102637 / 172P1) TaxID=29540 RepID=M0AHM6_NATA1|nr:hypothetical protein C481_19740 [Natrialba asiatica DSM 12278]